jgi:hypothetical protein
MRGAPRAIVINVTETPTLPSTRLARPVRFGDTVEVTVEQTQLLAIRQQPGRAAATIAQVPAGTRFTITGLSTEVDGVTWWPIMNSTVSGWAAEFVDRTRVLTPIQETK